MFYLALQFRLSFFTLALMVVMKCTHFALILYCFLFLLSYNKSEHGGTTMASVNITIRMDENDKKDAEKLFSELGLTMNAAFNMFAKQAIREQAIPFKVAKKPDIEYMDKAKLNKLYAKSSEKHAKAYEELAK